MNRCLSYCALALALLAPGAQAQTGTTNQAIPAADGSVEVVRTFPANALRGTLVVTLPPEVTLDGVADRLSPGSRIRGTNGMLVLSGSLAGQTLPVMATREPNGMLHDVWVLTDIEAQRLPAKPSYSR